MVTTGSATRYLRDGDVVEVEQVAGDGPGLGARYREMHNPRPGKAVPLDIEVRAFDAPRHMELFEEDLAAQLLVHYDLEPLDGDRTRITQTTDLHRKGQVPFERGSVRCWWRRWR